MKSVHTYNVPSNTKYLEVALSGEFCVNKYTICCLCTLSVTYSIRDLNTVKGYVILYYTYWGNSKTCTLFCIA